MSFLGAHFSLLTSFETFNFEAFHFLIFVSSEVDRSCFYQKNVSAHLYIPYACH